MTDKATLVEREAFEKVGTPAPRTRTWPSGLSPEGLADTIPTHARMAARLLQNTEPALPEPLGPATVCRDMRH